jgi:hypothetical protein
MKYDFNGRSEELGEFKYLGLDSWNAQEAIMTADFSD